MKETLYTVNAKIEAYKRRQLSVYQRELSVAWYTALWSRVEKLPSHDEVLKIVQFEPEPELSEEQEEALLAAHLKAHGDRLRRNANLMDPAQ